MRLTRPMRAAWAAVLTAAIAVAVLGAGMPAVAAQASGDGAGSGQDAGPDVTEGLEPGTLEGGIEPDPGAGAASLAYPNLGARLSALAVAAASAVGGEGGAGNSSESGSYATAMIGLSITFDGDSEQAVEAITAVGGDVRNVFDGYVEAFVPSTALAALAQIPGLTWARELAVPHKDRGRYTSGGVAAHLADAWHDAGITGGGVKIGVIDASSGVTARDGFTGLRSAMASGDLPATVVGRCYKAVALATSDIDDCAKAGGDSHGMSVAATVMDVAPDASLYISNARTWGDLQRSVEWMKNQGVGVIVHSTSWSFHGAADGTTPVNPSPLRTVKWAADNGIVWVNSGGNRNGKTWFGAFTDADNDNIHEWATGDEYQEFTLNAGESKDAVFMRWDDAWGTASKDLALLVVKNPGTASEQVVDNLNDEQKGASNSFPFEFKSFTAPHAGTYAFVVKKMSGAAPGWIQMATFGSLAHSTTGHSVISPADSPHAGVLAVGAASTASSDIRSYSSLGPTPDGRVKPDIVGADGYVAVSGTNYGTSYAAPHVAGLAALVRQQNPEFSAVQTAEYLKTHAAPRGNPYPNNTWGHGFAQLPPLGCVDRLDGDGTVSGAWTSGCTSAVHTQKSSRYYTFTISQQSTVTIDLSSSVDGYLYLRNGYNNQKDVALHTDDNSGTGADARISASLAAGTYTIEATTASTGQTGAFTLAVSGGLTEVSEVGISAGADITEGGNAVFTLTATPAPPSPLTATVEITADGDWGITPRTQTVTIPATGTATLTLATYNDSTEEYDGSVTMRVIGKPAYVVSSTADAATVAVSDDDGGAPCTDPITGDGTTNSELTLACHSFTRDAHANFFTFSVAEPRVVTIEMNAFDDGYKESTYLYLRQGNGTLRGPALYEDDNSGPVRDSKIVAVLDPGDYTIEATLGWDNNGGGPHLTKFALVTSGLTSSQPTVPHIRIAADGVTEGDDVVFNLRALPAPAADLQIPVDITQLGAFGFSPSIESTTVTIPTSGRATLTFTTQNDSTAEDDGWVTAALNDGQGYTVSTARRATSAVADDDGAPPCSITLSGNGNMTGELFDGCQSVDRDGSYARFYTFTMSQRGKITIQMNGTVPVHGGMDTRDTYLNLRSGNDVKSGALVASDSGSWLNAKIDRTIDPGTYTIEATSYKPDTTGAFELVVDGITEDNGTCIEHLTGDGTSKGAWASSCTSSAREGRYARFYTFELKQRSTIAIDLKSSIDSYLFLRSGNDVRVGTALHTNDDGGTGSDARISQSLASGWYTIEATTYRRAQSGRFDLEVSGIPAPAATPEVSIAAGADITEGGNATFTVTADPAPSADLDVAVAVSQAGDFGVSPVSQTVTIPTTGSAVLTVTTANDSVGEYDGAVTATVTAGAGYTVSTASGSATVAVADDDGGAPCSVRLSGNGSVDGRWTSDCASTDRTNRYARFYSFNLSQQSAVTIELASFEDNYLYLRAGEDTQTGTALHSNDDYRSPSTDAGISETLAAGWYTIEATTFDQAVSGDFTLTVSGLTAQPTGPEVSIAAGSGITEGGDAVFTVTADPAPSAALDVTVAITQSGDFGVTPTAQTVSIPTSGAATLTVTTANDSADEADGSVTATIDTGSGYTISSTAGAATVAVADDDDPLCDTADAISRARAAFAWHTDNNGGNEVVFWQVLAYLGADPLPAPPGGTVSASTTPEAVKAFSDGKSWPGWVPINAAMSCHPPPPEVSITAGVDIDEGGVAVFTVTADPAPTAALAVTVAVSASGDFGVSPGSHTVTIPTTGSATLTVATAGDSADEADGSVTAAVSAGSGYRVSATVGSASVGVADDDVPVVSIAGGADVGEGGDAVFTVSASPAPWAGLDVSVAVAQTGDFGVTPGSRTVTVPTSGTATLTVTTADDSADEADGSVTATVGIGSGYTVSATAGTAAVAVRDDDDPPVSDPVVSITAGSGISEGGDAVFTVSAVPAPSAALTVTVSVSQTGDYGITGGSRQVTIPASGTATLTVATANDSTDEADGSVTANLSTGAGYTVSAAAGSASVAVSDDDDAVPVADPCVAVLSGDGSVTGQWAAGCGSSARAGRFARFFSFSLDSPGRVTIDLESSADTYLYLRRGVGQRSGAAVASDDDGGGSFDSRISRTLGAGGYTIEATTFHASTPGSFTLTVAGIPAQTVVQPDPEVAIAAGGGITEGGDAVFTVSAVPVPSAALDVTVAVAQLGDFGVSPGSRTVTIPTSGSAVLRVATANDSTDEADGSVTATVGAGSGYTVSASSGSASVAVADDDSLVPPVSVCVPSLPSDAVTVSEVTGWRDAHSGSAHVLRWNRVLAALGTDTGETPMTVEQSRANESVFIPGRWDRVTRTLEALGQCADPSAVTPEISITAGAGVTEGGDATFTVTADPAPSSPLTVTVSVAQSGDFGVSPGSRTVTVPTGGSVTLTVATANDTADEADGSVTATVSAASGYTVSPTAGTATVAVQDDDDPAPPPPPVADPEVSITAGGGVTEGGDATFTVTADPAPTAPLTVDVTVAQVGDFGVSPGSRTVTVPTGGSVTLTVATANDTADEADGSVTATVSAGSGYTVSPSAGTATVAVADDDDPPPPPAVDPVVSVTAGGGVTEGGDATFTVTADPAPSAALTVEVTIAQVGDYGVAAGSRQVTIPTSGTVTLTVATTGDSTDEADGTVTATVGSGSGYTVSPSAGTAAVAVADDDDPPPNATPSLSISDASASEGGTLTFTVTLSPASGRYVWVHYYARPAFGAELSATFADFAQAYGMLTFRPGETTKTITVAAVDDSSPEDDETFRVVLYSAAQAAVADGEGVGTITDND
ncbi:Calx-beta domain-containing protein [Candidatus Poriferisodalis sp.]|uniref:Calx-beta domain-containing protein n=1 Tax=Candidatus Poriferisodalis sp. TaxID=3101277 RepID=UPI003B58E770